MPLPWGDVNAQPGFTVAKLLEPHGLTPARERYKWACPTPACTSSDGFHTFPRGGRRSKCYVCQTVLTNVDLTALVRGESPRDACRWLADQLGIYVEPWMPGSSPPRISPGVPPTRPRVVRPPTPLEALLASPNPVLPAVLYADVLDRTALTPTGAAYLRRRGIPAGFARSIGFRSVDGPRGWTERRKHLHAAYPPETLRAAGFPPRKGRVWMPFGGLVPMLLIPFRSQEQTIFLRMRTIGPPPRRLRSLIDDWDHRGNRYRAPVDVVPSLPFNADALSSQVVHVVEGELNATTLILPAYGLAAIGLPGAGVMEPRWIRVLGGARRVVSWYDDDAAGCLARASLAASFTAAHGAQWTASRLFHMSLPKGRDPNQLHVERALSRLIEPAPWLAGEPAAVGAPPEMPMVDAPL
jgi:hypothetical protein